MIMERSGEERLKMGCSMFDAAKALMRAGILDQNPHASPAKIRRALFMQLYGHEFDADSRCEDSRCHRVRKPSRRQVADLRLARRRSSLSFIWFLWFAWWVCRFGQQDRRYRPNQPPPRRVSPASPACLAHLLPGSLDARSGRSISPYSLEG